MKEFYIEAIKEMQNYIDNEPFYSKKEFGKLTGLEWKPSKKDMIESLQNKIEEYKLALSKI